MNLNTSQLLRGLVNGRRECLAKSITLIESSRKDHQTQAQQLLSNLNIDRSKIKQFQYNQTLRLGIAGPPGIFNQS